MTIFAERDRRHIFTGQSRGEFQFLANFRLQLIQEMRTGRHRITLGEFARDRGAPDLIVGFKHQHSLASLGQQRRTHQAVVAGTHYNCIEFISHRQSSPVRHWDVSDR